MWALVGRSGAEWGLNPLLAITLALQWGRHSVLLGQFTYTLDDKGRLTIPSRFRDELPVNIVVTRGLDRCLTVYPIDVWKEISQKVTSLPYTDPRGRTLRRVFFADAVAVELDKQGRVLIPDRLREHAGLDLSSEVLVVGLDRFIELWDPARWESQNETETANGDPALWADLGI
jgi:MraZ protein